MSYHLFYISLSLHARISNDLPTAITIAADLLDREGTLANRLEPSASAATTI